MIPAAVHTAVVMRTGTTQGLAVHGQPWCDREMHAMYHAQFGILKRYLRERRHCSSAGADVHTKMQTTKVDDVNEDIRFNENSIGH